MRAQVVKLLGVDLGDRRGVGAADVVGLDLQAGDRVGVGRLGEEQVAALLEGVGLLGARGRRGSSRARPRSPIPRGRRGRRGRRSCSGPRAPGWCRSRGAGSRRRRRRRSPVRWSPGPASRVSIRTLPRAEPKPSATQSRCASRSTSARWVREHPAALAEALGGDVAEVGAGADAELGDRVEEAESGFESVVSHCSQTSASAPSSSTIRVRKESAAPSASWTAAICAGASRRLPRGT